jgi:hypothetical protein
VQEEIVTKSKCRRKLLQNQSAGGGGEYIRSSIMVEGPVQNAKRQISFDADSSG